MTIIKKKKQRCGSHSIDRNWDEYILSFTVTQVIEYYECKCCKDELDKQLDRERRIKENNDRQAEESHRKLWARINKKQEERKKDMNDNLWDCVVRQELLRGMNNKHLIEFPKEMLQLKRASMKLDRLIKDRKRQLMDKHKLRREENKLAILRNSLPVKICRTHGNLRSEDVIMSGRSRYTGDQLYKCKKCMRDLHEKYYKENKDHVNKKTREYRISNPEKIKQIGVNYRRKIRVKNNNNGTTTQ